MLRRDILAIKLKLCRDGKKEQISPEEVELLIQEVSERLKDVVYMMAKEETRKMLNELKAVDFDDTFTFHFKVKMVGGDFFQILGRGKRK